MSECISKRFVGVAASLLVSAPAAALACPVCGFVGTSSNTWAYQAMTAVLSLLPLMMIGATVWWFARLAARAGTERPSATERVVAHPQLGGSETQGASAGQEVAFDSPLQGASPTRRGPHPVGSSITAAG